MNVADAHVVYDLARAAVDEALDSLQRKAQLMPNPFHKPAVVMIAATMLQAKTASILEVIGPMTPPEMVNELAAIGAAMQVAETSATKQRLDDFFGRHAGARP